MKIRALISAETDMKFVGDAGSAMNAVNLVRVVPTDVILMSVGMPGTDIFEATKYIKMERPLTKVVILAEGEDESRLIDRGMETIYMFRDSEIRGYISKQSPAEEMLEVIRQVSAVCSCFCLPVTRLGVQRLSRV